jgi:hypothetical protein
MFPAPISEVAVAWSGSRMERQEGGAMYGGDATALRAWLMRIQFVGILMVFASLSRADDAGRLGVTYCAPPLHPPECVDKDSTFQQTDGAEACRRDIQTYVSSVFEYRKCLEREIGQINLEANGLLDRFKCRTGERTDCHPRKSSDSK